MDNQFKPANQQPNTNSPDDNLIHPGSAPNAYQPTPRPVEPDPKPVEPTPQPVQAPQPEQPVAQAQPAAAPSFDVPVQAPPAAEPTPSSEAVPREEAVAAAAPTKPKKKRNTKKILLTAFALLLIVGGAALAYFFVFNTSEPAQPVVTQPAPKETVPIAKDSIFYQAGQRIVKYDTKKKQKTDLTDKLPAATEVIDFYTEGDTWRAYAQTTGSDEMKIYYLESGKEPQEVYAKKRFVAAAANAKSKQVAYTEVFEADDRPEAVNVNKHFLLKESGEPVLLAESEPQRGAAGGDPKNDIKQLNWGVGSFSPDGSKLMFNYTKWYGHGPLNGSLEYNISTKQTRLVTSEGSAQYDSKGQVFVERTNFTGLGWLETQTPLQLTLRKEVSPGTYEEVLVVSNNRWASLTYQSPHGAYLVAYARGPQYPAEGSSVFDGFYQTVKPNELKKVEIKNLPPANEYAISEIGKAAEQADVQCFGVLLIDNKATVQEGVPATYKVGKVCSDEDQALTYEEVETITVPANTTQPLKFL